MIEIYKRLDFSDKYAVSNKGNLVNRKSGRSLKQFISKNGYKYVNLSHKGILKTFRVHRLVAFAFLPNKALKPYINHKDGNKQNNNVDNLEWCTAKENDNHARLLKLKDQNKPVKVINLLDNSIYIYESLSECSRYLGVNKGNIHRVLSGKRFRYRNYHFEYI